MRKNKYLFLAIIPLFAVGFFTTTLLKDDRITVEQSTAKAESLPLMGPKMITSVVAPVVETPAPEPTQQPAPAPAAQPAPKSSPKVASKPASSQPRIQSSNTTITPTPRLAPAAPSCSGGFATEFICLLNQYRSSKGLGSLSYSSSISAVALAHSIWMNTTGTFSHVDANGGRMVDRCAAAGTVCRAENLAKGATSPQQLLDMWKASSGHNANLLGPYKVIGIGISGVYITADFN